MTELYGYVINLVDNSAAAVASAQASVTKLVDSYQSASAVVAKSFAASTAAAVQSSNAYNTALKQSLLEKGAYNALIKQSTGNLQELRAAADLIRQQRDLIPKSQTESIRQANLALKATNKEIAELENLNGGAIAAAMNQVVNVFPQVGLLANPVLAVGSGLTLAAGQAMSFEEQMAKINTTAQMSAAGLAGLADQIREAGGYSVSPTAAAAAYEQIISITNDAAGSVDILRMAAKGAEAGFTDINSVAQGLSYSMAALGNQSATAEEVLDTLFAAKRFGAGEFGDFAKYMPGLIAQGNLLGFTYKEVAGAFSFMSSKVRPEAASTLMSNMLSSLSKADVQAKMRSYGIAIDDGKGKLLGFTDLMANIGTALGTEENKAPILEALGLHDVQANQAYALLTGDLNKLKQSIEGVQNAAGEANRALEASENSTRSWHHVMNQGLAIAESLGSVILVVLSPAMDLLSGTVEFVTDAFWGLATGLGVLSAAMLIVNGEARSSVLAWGADALAKGVATVQTWLLTASTTALGQAIKAIPLVGWALAAAGAMITLYNTWDGFRHAVHGTWGVLKEVGKAINAIMSGNWKQVLELDFAKAYETARNQSIKDTEEERKNSPEAQAAAAQNALTNLTGQQAGAQKTAMAMVPGMATSASATTASDPVVSSGRTSINIEKLSVMETINMYSDNVERDIIDIAKRAAKIALQELNGAVMSVQ